MRFDPPIGVRVYSGERLGLLYASDGEDVFIWDGTSFRTEKRWMVQPARADEALLRDEGHACPTSGCGRKHAGCCCHNGDRVHGS